MSSLDAKRSAAPILRRLLLQKCTLISLLPGIRAARIGSETARLKPGSTAPTGTQIKLPAEWHEEFEACDTDRERLGVLKRMDRVIAEHSRGTRLEQRRGTREWKLRIATDTRASAIVGLEYDISASRVRQLRMDYVAGRLS